MNRKTQGAIRKFKDADGNYLWQPPAGAGQAATLMSFPVVEAEDMPSSASLRALGLSLSNYVESPSRSIPLYLPQSHSIR